MDTRTLKHYQDLAMSDLLWVTQLVAVRRRKGLTQQQVADRMGVDQSAVSKLENINSGARKISADQLNRYARAVGAYTTHVVVDADSDYTPMKRAVEDHARSLLGDDENTAADTGTPADVIEALGKH